MHKTVRYSADEMPLVHYLYVVRWMEFQPIQMFSDPLFVRRTLDGVSAHTDVLWSIICTSYVRWSFSPYRCSLVHYLYVVRWMEFQPIQMFSRPLFVRRTLDGVSAHTDVLWSIICTSYVGWSFSPYRCSLVHYLYVVRWMELQPIQMFSGPLFVRRMLDGVSAHTDVLWSIICTSYVGWSFSPYRCSLVHYLYVVRWMEFQPIQMFSGPLFVRRTLDGVSAHTDVL